MIREDLAEIPDYVPGKRLPEALKLSSNEVAHPPLESAVTAMTQAAAGANRYPDMFATELTKELATRLGVTEDQVAVGCGSSALCQQLVQVTTAPCEEVIFPWRSFEGYPIFARVHGATPVAVPLTENGYQDLSAMAAAITDKTRLVFLCNPNNPTGTTISHTDFEKFMAQVPSHVVVALDEAYIEYCRDLNSPIATEAIQRWPNVIGLRTFSKAYGLAGVRVGYAFGNSQIIAALKKVSIPFAVSAVAQAGALASLKASEELLRRAEEAVGAREDVAKKLGIAPSEANFAWLPATSLPHPPAEVAAKLAAAGVLVRAFPEGVRVTVTTQAEAEGFLQAWDEAIAKLGK